jgi:hypothetical protein
MTGAGGQEHRHPLRRASVGVVDLRQLARHTGSRHVRGESGAEDGSDADEDERTDARRVLLCLWVEKTRVCGHSAPGCPHESTAKPRSCSIPSLGRPQGPRGAAGVRWCGLGLPSRAQPGDGPLSPIMPGHMCTGISSLVAWAGAASSATSLVVFAFFILACSAATCLAAALAAILVVTAALSAADSLLVFTKSFGTKKTWWSCERGMGWGVGDSPTARCGSPRTGRRAGHRGPGRGAARRLNGE